MSVKGRKTAEDGARGARTGARADRLPVPHFGRHQRAGADGLVLHAADLRPRACQRQPADAGRDLGPRDRALPVPGDVRHHPLAGARAHRRADRPPARAARARGGGRHAAARLLDVGGAGARAATSTRCANFFGSQAPMAIFDLPVDAALPRLRVPPAPDPGRAHHRGGLRADRPRHRHRTADAELEQGDHSRPPSNATPSRIRTPATPRCSRRWASPRARSTASRRPTSRHLELQTRTSDISGTFGAISRVLRMLLQSAILGLAAYLTILGELSAGAIIAATIAASRAMAPIDLAIGNWKHDRRGPQRLEAGARHRGGARPQAGSR